MAVLKRYVAPGMTQAAYDQASGHVSSRRRRPRGLSRTMPSSRTAASRSPRFGDSVEQHDAWWDAHLRGVVPADLPRPEFAEIHRINSK